MEPASAGSNPFRASSTSAQSSTLRAMGPALSSDQHSAMPPARLTRPNVGRRAVVPQRIEGETSEPSVSVPMANAQRPAAVALADPALEPDEPSRGSKGLRVTPPNQTSP